MQGPDHALQPRLQCGVGCQLKEQRLLGLQGNDPATWPDRVRESQAHGADVCTDVERKRACARKG